LLFVAKGRISPENKAINGATAQIYPERHASQTNSLSPKQTTPATSG
jgi:hypothetical protein